MKDNRLFRILYYIFEKGKVTASELADKFEVSVRAIYRDNEVVFDYLNLFERKDISKQLSFFWFNLIKGMKCL